MRTFVAIVLCATLSASVLAESRRPAAVFQKPLQRDGAHHHDHHDHGHDQGAAAGGAAYSDSGFGGSASSYSQGGGSDYTAGGNSYSGGDSYAAAPAAAAYPAPAPASGYSSGSAAAPAYPADASSYNAAPAADYGAAPAGDYGNTQSQGYYYYYYPVQDSKGSKLKTKAKGAWDNMWGSVSSLAGKIPKLPAHYKEDDDSLKGLAIAALVLLIIAALLLVTVPMVSLAVPSFTTGTNFNFGSIFNTTGGNGLTIDLSFLGIPLTLFNPFFGRETSGGMWSSWFTPENVDKVSSYVMEKIEDYRMKVE